MKLHLLAVGTQMPDWVKFAVRDYTRRLPAEYGFVVQEIPLAARGGTPDIEQIKRIEAEQLLAALPEDAHLVVLDERGTQWTTPQLAERLAAWDADGRDVALVIGGPDGLAPELLQRADESWGISNLVLPHALVRVVVAEALYRAWSVNAGHPYHRA